MGMYWYRPINVWQIDLSGWCGLARGISGPITGRFVTLARAACRSRLAAACVATPRVNPAGGVAPYVRRSQSMGVSRAVQMADQTLGNRFLALGVMFRLYLGP